MLRTATGEPLLGADLGGGSPTMNRRTNRGYYGRGSKGVADQLCALLRRHWVPIFVSAVIVGGCIAAGILIAPPDNVPRHHTAKPAEMDTWIIDYDPCLTGVVTPGSLRPLYNETDGRVRFAYECQGPFLTWRSYATMAVTGVTLVAMMANAPADIAMMVASMTLVLLGAVSTDQFCQGFASQGVLSVGVLFIVATAVQESGAVDVLLRAALGSPSSLAVALLRLLVPVVVCSAFLNNTPVVAMLIPLVESWSVRIGIPKSKLLMPLSFASMLGGMCTLIGTSTNLILAGLYAEDYPDQAIGMFGMSKVGAPLALAGTVYLILVSNFLLPVREDTVEVVEEGDAESGTAGSATKVAADGAGSDDDDAKTRVKSRTKSTGKKGGGGMGKRYRTSFIVQQRHAGQPLSGTGLLTLDGVTVLTVERGGDGSSVAGGIATADPTLAPEALGAKPDTILQAGDVIHLVAVPEVLAKVRQDRGLEVAPQGPRELGRKRRHRFLVEAVLDRGSPLVGRTVSQCEVLPEYGAALVAVRLGGANRRAVPVTRTASLPSDVAAAWTSTSGPFDAVGDGSSNGTSGTSNGLRASQRDRVGSGSGGAAVAVSMSPMTGSPVTARGTDNTAGAARSAIMSEIDGVGASSRGVTPARKPASMAPKRRGPHAPLTRNMSSLGVRNDVRLRPGDGLLLEVFPDFLQHYRHSAHFAMVREVAGSKPPRVDTAMDTFRLVFSAIALGAMVVLTALRITSLFVAATLAALAFVASKILTLQEAFAAVKGRVLLAIIGAFGVGAAIENTAVAAVVADGLVHLMTPFGPFALLCSCFVVASLLGVVISNNSVVIIMFPVAEKANVLVPEVPLQQFVIVLMMAASCSFLSPVSYQTNLMVWAPGGYRFSDFPRLGTPLQVALMFLSVLLTMYFF